jgi:hypothetical protein
VDSVFAAAGTGTSVGLNVGAGKTLAVAGTLTVTGSATVEFADGSAASPSITNDGDTNTGIFFPAADTIAFAEGGAEVARFDSSGNFGLGVTPSSQYSTVKAFQVGVLGSTIVTGQTVAGGTSSFGQNWYVDPTTAGFFYAAASSQPATRYSQYAGQHQWFYASAGTAGNAISFTQAMTLNASGNLAIGSTSANARLHVYGANTASAYAQTALIQENIYPNSAFPSMAFQTWAGGNAYKSAVGGNGTDLCFYTSSTYGVDPTERARIDGGGSLLVGRTSALSSEKFGVTQSAANLVAYWTNSNATTPSGLYMNYSAASPNNTGSNFIQVGDSSANRFIVNSNGGIQNYSANNVNLSDQREKKNIELAGNYLDKICAIPIKTFLFNDQTDTDKNLGAIAQDVQAVAPELVMESDWGTKEEPKIRLSIYQTDLQYALMKCIQEMKTIIDEQAQRISVLEAK